MNEGLEEEEQEERHREDEDNDGDHAGHDTGGRIKLPDVYVISRWN